MEWYFILIICIYGVWNIVATCFYIYEGWESVYFDSGKKCYCYYNPESYRENNNWHNLGYNEEPKWFWHFGLVHYPFWKGDLNLFGKITFPILCFVLMPMPYIVLGIIWLAEFTWNAIVKMFTWKPTPKIKEGKKQKIKLSKIKLSKKELVNKVDELRGLLDDERTENRLLENKLERANDDLYCANKNYQTAKNYNLELEGRVNHLTNEINNLHNYESENQALKKENEELRRLHGIDLEKIAKFESRKNKRKKVIGVTK